MNPTELLQQLTLAGLLPPRILTFALTSACNLACHHCWVSATKTTSSTHVPLRTARRLLENFAAIGGYGIRITGGEPLCHPHWQEILLLSRSLGFKTVILQSNAMLLNDGHLALLHEVDFPGFAIQISLDGATAATHDFGRGAGAFTTTLDGISRLVQEGFAERISLFMTEMRHNLEDIPALLEFADSMKIPSVSSGALVLCGRAAERTTLFPPATGQYLDLLDRYAADPRFRELYRKIGRTAAVEWRAGDTIRRESCTFIENPYLTPSGVLYPCLLCHADDYAVTAVFEKGLAAAIAEAIPLWSSLLRISSSRSTAIAECRDCPGKPYCAGGCMGRAWGSFGNLLAADDRCEVRRAIYQHTCTSR